MNWVPAVNTSPSGAGTSADLAISSASVFAYSTLFCVNARDIDTDGTAKNEMWSRTSTRTYARGYAETTRFTLTGGAPWRHRRIVFNAKNFPSVLAALDPNNVPAFYALYTSNGQVRQNCILPSAVRDYIEANLFRGAKGTDWNLAMTARTNTIGFRIVSDKTYNLNPGNASGKSVIMKRWTPINKNIVYNEDEAGTTGTSVMFSTGSRDSVGDYFIYDIYESTVPDSNSALSITHEGRYYWHEK